MFTYNDFSNTIVEPVHTPHLVTEHNGHMFSTKTSDQEERQIEHAMRHARVQNAQMGMRNVAGAIGWCAFDYNTHLHFGSGDRICYHGVMDIFRLPKFAAYLYAAQGVKPPFVSVASFWTPGDRSGGGNDPLTIFSNCESPRFTSAANCSGGWSRIASTFRICRTRRWWPPDCRWA